MARIRPERMHNHGRQLRRDHYRRRSQWSGDGVLSGRAGWKVLVLERRHVVGGACVTEEVFPGFKVSTAAYVNSLFRKEIIRDLRLADHGFAVLERNPSSFSPFPDGRYLLLGPDGELNRARDRQVQRPRRRELSPSTRPCWSASPT